jgi:BirA family biotin operon repressor/biotin-[acetyl-CoA-carboxylase] ligase
MQANTPDINAPLLHTLMSSRGDVDLAGLAQATGLAAAELHHEVERLEGSGCVFDHQPRSIRLVEVGPGVWQDYLVWRLATPNHKNDAAYRLRDAAEQAASEAAGARSIHVYQTTGSTQDGCRRIIEAKGAAADGAIVTAHHQQAGRGRLGRTWVAPPGASVTVSLVHVTGAPAAAAVERLMLAIAVGAANAIEAVAPLNVSLKWPNDLLIDGRKLGGILVETQQLASGETAAIIGIGINVSLRKRDLQSSAPELIDQVTSVAMQQEHTHRLLLLGQVVIDVEGAIRDMSEGELLDAWRFRSVDLGQRIHLREGNRDVIGEVIDIDPQQGIVIRTEVGSVVHLPAATTTVVKRG